MGKWRFWKSWENLLGLGTDQFPKSHASLLRQKERNPTISSNLVSKLPKPVTYLHCNYFFLQYIQMVFHLQRPWFTGYVTIFKEKKKLKKPSLSICQASTRVAGASDKGSSYFTSSGKKCNRYKYCFQTERQNFGRSPIFFPLYWSENDIMTWWSQLPNTSEADFRSTRWHYSEVLLVLVLLAGSTALKKNCYFPYENLLLTTVVFPLQKG